MEYTNDLVVDSEIPEYGTSLNMSGNLKQYIMLITCHTCSELSAKMGPGGIP